MTTQKPDKKVRLLVSVNGGQFNEVFRAMNKVTMDFRPLTDNGINLSTMTIKTADGNVIEFLCEYVNENANSGIENY